MELFQNTFERGSIVGLLLLVYSMNVGIEVLRVRTLDHAGVFSARLPYSGLATIFLIAVVPCIVWPALYVGLYDGWLAALVAWIAFQVLGAYGTLRLGLRGAYLAFHTLTAMVALPVGYYLTWASTPWA